MWLQDEDNGKEFVDNVGWPVYNDTGVMQSWEIEFKKVNDPSNTCHSKKNDSNKGWPGHSIFKCTCKSNVRAYSISIDGKVFENIVSKEMVDKIKLKIEPHVKP